MRNLFAAQLNILALNIIYVLLPVVVVVQEIVQNVMSRTVEPRAEAIAA